MGILKLGLNVFCKGCQKPVHVASARVTTFDYFKQGFCSRKCKKILRESMRICEVCGNHLKENSRKFCSEVCYYSSKKGRVVNRLFGSRNPKWNPNKKSRTYPSGYLKKKVLERFQYKCLECGGGKDLHVHHIVPFKVCHTHRLDNLIVGCYNCHWNWHRLDRERYEKKMDFLKLYAARFYPIRPLPKKWLW